MSETKFKVGDKVSCAGRSHTVVAIRPAYDLADNEDDSVVCVFEGSLEKEESLTSIWINRDIFGNFWCGYSTGPGAGWVPEPSRPRVYLTKEDASTHAQILERKYYRAVQTLEFTRKT